MLLPSHKRGAQAAGVSDVLPEGQPAVDVQSFVIWAGNGKVMVLIDEALCLVRESLNGLVIPPIGEISCLIKMSTS